MLGVVDVRREGNDRRDGAVLGFRRGDERRDGAVAGEVARAADAVHHAGAGDVRRVHVAVDVSLDETVRGDEREATDDLRVVGDLLRTHDDLLAVELGVLVHLVGVLRRQREGGGRCDGHLAGVDQVDHAVLDDLRVGLDVLELGVPQTSHDRVRDVADAGLHDVLVVLETACGNLGLEEVEEVASDLLRGLVERLEGGVAVSGVGFDDCDDLGGVDVDVRGTDALACALDRDDLAVRGLADAPDVGHAFEILGLPGVDLDDDALSCVEVFDVVADARGRDDVAVGVDAGGLDDGDVQLAVVASGSLPTGVRQVAVGVADLAGVDGLPHDRIRLIGGAEADGIGFRHDAVTVGGCRSTGEHVDLEFLAAGVVFLRLVRDRGGDGLRVGGARETGHAHAIAMIDELDSLVSRHHLATEFGVVNAGHLFSLPRHGWPGSLLC